MIFFQNDIEIPVPKYFIFENAKAMKEREKLMGSILAKKGPVDTTIVSYTVVLSIFQSDHLYCEKHQSVCYLLNGINFWR